MSTRSAHPEFPPTPTPADLLQRAATEMRGRARLADDLGDEWFDGFLGAVADWLASCAVVLEVNPAATKAHALNVAHAFLGDLA